MTRVWSEEAKLERWLDVELAALDAWAQVGTVPASSARAVRERARVPSPERVAELERTTNHDVAAFVDVGLVGARAGGPLVPLRPHLVGRARHRSRAHGAGRGSADPRWDRPRIRGGRRPRAGAPRHDHDRPDARSPCRADDLRSQAAGLGVRARARPWPARPRTRRNARGQALGCGRDLRDHDAGCRAHRVRGAGPRARAQLDADPPARPPRRAPDRSLDPRLLARPLRSRDPAPRADRGA